MSHELEFEFPGVSGMGCWQVKLDRLVGRHGGMGRSAARRLILDGRVRVMGVAAERFDVEVDRFDAVMIDDELVQAGEARIRIMLHKPVGVVSATRDALHPTVIDLIDHPERHTLHLAGRLDRFTSGLVLLTNDGNWSKSLMNPDHKVPKIYQVETRDPISPADVEAFAKGFYFHTEDITTLPAELEVISARRALLTLHEGRYHQIKRMFHRTGNLVTALHRVAIGTIVLPPDLLPGEWGLIPE